MTTEKQQSYLTRNYWFDRLYCLTSRISSPTCIRPSLNAKPWGWSPHTKTLILFRSRFPAKEIPNPPAPDFSRSTVVTVPLRSSYFVTIFSASQIRNIRTKIKIWKELDEKRNKCNRSEVCCHCLVMSLETPVLSTKLQFWKGSFKGPGILFLSKFKMSMVIFTYSRHICLHNSIQGLTISVMSRSLPLTLWHFQ